MVKCPKCNEEVSSLTEWSKCWVDYDLEIGADGGSEWTRGDNMEETNEVEYVCPECLEVVFCHQDEAIAFLKGKVMPKC